MAEWLQGEWNLWESRSMDLAEGYRVLVFLGQHAKYGAEIHRGYEMLDIEHDGKDTPEAALASVIGKFRRRVQWQAAALCFRIVPIDVCERAAVLCDDDAQLHTREGVVDGPTGRQAALAEEARADASALRGEEVRDGA